MSISFHLFNVEKNEYLDVEVTEGTKEKIMFTSPFDHPPLVGDDIELACGTRFTVIRRMWYAGAIQDNSSRSNVNKVVLHVEEIQD